MIQSRNIAVFAWASRRAVSPIAASKAATSWRVSLVLGFAGKFVAHTHIHMYMHVHSECRQKTKSISSINGSVLISLVDQFINVLLG